MQHETLLPDFLDASLSILLPSRACRGKFFNVIFETFNMMPESGFKHCSPACTKIDPALRNGNHTERCETSLALHITAACAATCRDYSSLLGIFITRLGNGTGWIRLQLHQLSLRCCQHICIGKRTKARSRTFLLHLFITGRILFCGLDNGLAVLLPWPSGQTFADDVDPESELHHTK